MRSLSIAQARRLAIGAQGLTGTRATSEPTRRHLRKALSHTGLFQIDSVNVLARAHYLPAYSRIGPYDVSVLDRMAFKHREMFEYWGHEAALLPVELHPLMRPRMAYWESRLTTWSELQRVLKERPGYVDAVYQDVVDRGPVSAGEVAEDQKRGTANWGWNWTDAKIALEYLFYVGRITTSSRRNFERLYDIPERVIPAQILALPTPDEHEAQRQLLLLAAKSHGVGTLGDLADYYRLRNPAARPRLAELVEDGRLEEVEVRGWSQPAYTLPGAKIPRRVAGRALLVPFDPLIWERDRTERLFDFHYRIEIYVPARKRKYGYYVLPFLLSDALVARVDLKADRALGVLRVQAAWAEPGAPGETAAELAAELVLMAQWLGLGDVVVEPKGDLAASLTIAMKAAV
ncbi:MAG: YcaQ family DNA glycosylase [Frankiaceae bacterium]|nr:YcaQ family DNA glycosylase [Frankiaceae bacterium]MBV9869775.1 YcaQ family DNA glycosylase [Frankiaceae bacterium]